MDQATAKQQIVERVKQATNILVTVNANPTVDQLAACIGTTLLLNKMEKHATAVFSGKVPSTIEFLQPEKTIERNTDSLQDFIISLDKDKADKLRYKVEDQVVRIFITPYRTSLSEKDLVFSQGDFNVDVVLALGIKERSQIDQAIATHGRILHDATVISINAGAGNVPAIGQVNWQDPAASSLSEMLVSISEAFGTGLIDNQMATAFLTGIVSETDRFGNNHTSPKVMTMAAQLMAAGANQQLIASKLEPPEPVAPKPAPYVPPPKPKPTPAQIQDGTLSIPRGAVKSDEKEVIVEPNEILIDKEGNLKTHNDLPKELETSAPAPEAVDAPPPTVTVSQPAPEPTPEPTPAPEPEPLPTPVPEVTPPAPVEPTRASIKTITPPSENPQHALLDPAQHQSSNTPAFSADMQSEWIDPYNSVSLDPLSEPQSGAGPRHDMAATAPEVTPPSEATPDPAPQPAATFGVDDARSAVESALAGAPFDPATSPPLESLNAQPIGSELHGPQEPLPTPPQAPLTGAETPSLTLPINGNGPVSVEAPPAQAIDVPSPAAPPAMPPPLPLTSNPGAMLPVNANPQQTS